MDRSIKNIAIIEPVGGHGGMNYYDYSLATGLSNKDVNVFWYTCDKTSELGSSNICIKKYFKNIYGLQNKAIRFFRFVIGLIRSLIDAKSHDCELIHFHFFHYTILEFLMVLLANLFSYKIIITVHDVESFTSGSSSFFERFILNKTNQIIVHNMSSFSEMVDNNVNLKSKITIVPHGNYMLYVKKLNSLTCKNTLNINIDKFHILFFGQIKKVKGLDVLLKAISMLVNNGITDLQLTIAGKVWKDDFTEYDALIRENNLEEFVTADIRYIPDDEVDMYYNSADLVVLPYKKIYQSGVLLMAMSYSKPVLVSDITGMTEVICDNENGFVFESENVQSLKNKILFIKNNFNIRNSVVQKSDIDITTKFSWDEIADQTIKVYEKTKL